MCLQYHTRPVAALHWRVGTARVTDAVVGVADPDASAVSPAVPSVVLNNNANVGETHSCAELTLTCSVAHILSFVVIRCVLFNTTALVKIGPECVSPTTISQHHLRN